jgi:hypothetical protein
MTLAQSPREQRAITLAARGVAASRFQALTEVKGPHCTALWATHRRTEFPIPEEYGGEDLARALSMLHFTPPLLAI